MSNLNGNDEDRSESQLEVKDTTTHLYRIVPEVKTLILNALATVEKLPLSFDRALLDRAKRSLDNPIEKVIDETNNSVQPIISSSDKHSDLLKEAQWANYLATIRMTIEREMNGSENKEQLERILARIPKSV